ncbi:MAG: RNA polymerase sigma factor RpoE [Betaproteobacteria bacterium]|nr:RNA polymerase sigma factor RpoE [Betaproteobacteria bacterium]
MTNSEAKTPNEKDADQAIVRRVQSGDLRAFDLLVAKYQRRIMRLIGRFIRDPAQVEDLSQDTFLRAYRAIGQFRGESAFYTWLYRIAVNTAKKSLADGKRERLVSQTDTENEDGETFAAGEQLTDESTPEAELASRQIVAAVNAAVDDLPEELRQAITLREVEGLSYEEIAELMACPIGTVRSRIFRAREAIADRLKPVLENKTGKRW